METIENNNALTAEKRDFIKLLSQYLKEHISVKSMAVISKLCEQAGITPDEYSELLCDRYVGFDNGIMFARLEADVKESNIGNQSESKSEEIQSKIRDSLNKI